jgi:hypothetical protein
LYAKSENLEEGGALNLGTRSGIAAILFAVLVSSVQAVDLVLTRDGKSLWAQNIATNGSALTFVCNDTGKGTNIPLQQVETIIPGVTRGKQYSEDEITRALKAIAIAKGNHLNLMKQLKVLENDWEAMRLALGPEMKNRIDDILASFSTNKTSREAYSTAILNLDMLRCKDIMGVSSSKLDVAMDTVQQEYMGTSIRKLEIEAASPKLNVDAFLKIKGQVTRALGKDISADESNRLTKVLCNARTMTLKQELANVREAIATIKSVAGYLKCRTVLVRLKKDAAATKEEAFELERALSSVTAAARSALPDYDFSTGAYPLSKKDREHLAATQAYSSTQIVFGTPVEEQCFIVPNETPRLATLGNKLALPVTIVFNRLPIEKVEYGVALAGANDQPSTRSYTKLVLPALSEGHAEIRCPLNFPAAGQDFMPFRDSNGTYALVYLACRRNSEGKPLEDSDWKAISMACRIPVAN